MLITVTQDDIDDGLPESCSSCPVARALSRAFGEYVGCGLDCFSGIAPFSKVFGRLPPEVESHIRRFDTEGVMAPFQFEVADSTEVLRTL